MRNLHYLALVTSLGLSLAIAPAAQAKAKITKPSAPTISAISSSAVKMRKISNLATILIASFVMSLAGLVASPIATASENETVRVSAKFPFGTSVLTKAQKAAIKKAVTTAGTDATFLVTGAAGKLPGVSDSAVQLLAKKRAQVVESYLVKLGANKASVTIKVKITRIGIVPKTKIVGSVVAPVLTTTSAADTTNAPAAPTVALTCAAGGTCVVGDTGPGGGLIYYVDSSAGGFACGPTHAATCKYLEVAPSGWSSVSDPTKSWAVTAKVSSDIADIENFNAEALALANSQIGLGFKNSVAIVAQGNDTSTAAGAARAYAGNSKSDWYLPTFAELTLLCQWNLGVTQNVANPCVGGSINSGTGASSSGFVAENYWSSSEFPGGSWHQNFNAAVGDNRADYKSTTYRVRPVRAF